MSTSEPPPSALPAHDRPGSGVQGERRIITVLFGDVTGSTAIAEQLDPEEWADILNGLYELLTASVQRYDGTVARLLGDAVLALFGAPISHEDDPARAVLAGLAMTESVAAYRREVLRRYGHDFNVRIGINTGLVVVGGIGSGDHTEYTAVGDAVNVAARMEQTALPGTVQVAHDTYRFIAPLFDVEELGAIDVKGKSDPVRAYRILRVRTPAQVPVARSGLNASLIGRTHEMMALQRAVDLLRAGRGQVISIIGEAGLGKSRLLAELCRTLSDENRVIDSGSSLDSPHSIIWLEGRSFSYEKSTPYAPFVGILTRFTGLEASMSPAESYARLKTTIARIVPGQEQELTPYVAAIVDLPPDGDASTSSSHIHQLSPQQLRTGIFDALRTLIAALAQRQPVLLALEDLHWIDPTSLDLLLHLLPLTAQTMLAVVALYRLRPNELPWRYHEVASTEHSERYTSLVLGRLSDQNAQTLVADLLDSDALPSQVSRLILDKAEGNPFFLEEVVRSLVDAGWLIRSDGQWQTTRAIEQIAVPDTLSGVITARLDRLEPISKRVAQTAAVIGRAFAVDTLADVIAADAVERSALEDSLIDLERRELIHPALGRPQRSYMFKHVLTQETAYASLLLSRRRDLHRRVAECLERVEPDNVNDLARHFMEARLPERALPYFVAAGDRAARAYAAQEAIAHYSRGIEAAELAGAQTGHVRSARGRAYEMLGNFDEAQNDYEAALQLARTQHDLRAEWQALLDLGFLWASRDYEKTGDYYQQALTLARAIGDPATLADSLNRVGNWYLNVEQPRTAQRYHREALAIWEDLDDVRGLAVTLDLYGLASYRSGDFPQSHAPFHRAIDLFRRIGDRQGVASSLTTSAMVGSIYMDNDISVFVPVPIEDRIARVEEALQTVQAIHWRAGEAFSRITYARVLGSRGEIGKAMENVDTGLAIAQAIGHRQWTCAGYFFKGHLFTLILAWEQAQSILEDAMTLARALNSPLWTNMVSSNLGVAYLGQNNLDAVRVLLDSVVTPTTPMESYSQRRCWLLRAELTLIQGDPATALGIIERVYSELHGLSDRADVPYLALLHGEVLAALNRSEEAESIFRQVNASEFVEVWRPFKWQFHLSQSRFFHKQGRLDEARLAEAQARATAEAIAASVPDPQLRQSTLANAERALSRPPS